MTDYYSPSLPFLGHNSTVKAWCLTSNHDVSTATQTLFDSKNFVDGYNLRLDVASQTYATNTTFSGALKFSFLRPMANNKYKVLLSCYSATSLGPMLAHVLNSPTYPKTTDSFWIRVGWVNKPVGGATYQTPLATRTQNQMVPIRLWGNAAAKLSVVVL